MDEKIIENPIKLTTIAHLLSCLGEEGAEISQCCSKINRFGLHDVNILKPAGENNVQRLVAELNDLLAVVDMLVADGVIPPLWNDDAAKLRKMAKVRRFMRYARKKGTL